MKLNKNKWSTSFLIGLTLTVASCIDPIRFGDSFLEKAPGGDVTEDTVFNSAEYTRQYLVGMYNMQYYGLFTLDVTNSWHTYWKGHLEHITDLYQSTWSNNNFYKQWYTGSLQSSSSGPYCRIDFLHANIWGTIRAGWKLMEKIDNVPGLGADEKKQMIAQAKCLIASVYYELFHTYGGVPLVKQAYKGTEDSYDLPRATVEETVKFIVQLLDEASADLPWAFETSNPSDYDNPENDMGRWTRAGAKALKCKVLLFAASPLLNSAEAYAGGASEAEQQKLVWYGGYRQELWNDCLKACDDFFTELSQKGYYKLETPTTTNPTPGEYRIVYRRAYMLRESKEIIHSVRITSDKGKGNDFYTIGADRMGHPTLEYMEKFAWADGRPFDWSEAESSGKLDEMFVRWTDPTAKYNAGNAILTRDPRLYETMNVNGVPKTCSEAGLLSGDPWEIWHSGNDAKTNQSTNSGSFATGFLNNKFFGNWDTRSSSASHHWPTLRMADLMLVYAEAKLQNGDLTGAIKLVDEVRARVGLKGVVECNPGKNLTTDKQALLSILLNERACELGLEDSRLYDLTRYKLKDEFEKPLHLLMIKRLNADGTEYNQPWYGNDKNANKPFPSHFAYEAQQMRTGARVWWTTGFAPKWYLNHIIQTEVNKGYLIQNPGW